MPQLRFGYGKAFLPALVAGCTIVCLADGYGWCVEYWNWDGKRSNIRDGRRWPAGDGAVISYINGIFHSIPEWEKITGQLEALFGHEVSLPSTQQTVTYFGTKKVPDSPAVKRGG